MQWPSAFSGGYSWKLIWADIAEAVFIHLAVGQFVEPIHHHVVMASFESLVDPGCILDRQFQCSCQIPSTGTVWMRGELPSLKFHCECTVGKFVGT